MLQINHLYKNYGKFQAVNDLNLHIEKGDLFGFVGCLLYTSDAADEL